MPDKSSHKMIFATTKGGTSKSSDLPADEGHEAFRNRIDKNPYPESDWQHNEWQFGWDCEEQSNPDLYDHTADKFKTLR
jgi:hypothetical protein